MSVFEKHRDTLEHHETMMGSSRGRLAVALDLLTVVIIDDALFGRLFGGLVAVNDEGEVSMAPFGGPLPRPMQPAGAAALGLARRHRAALGL